MAENVAARVPSSVIVGISAQTLSRNKLLTIFMTVFIAFFMFAVRGWGALAMVPFVCAMWLVQIRTTGAFMEFTSEIIRVRAIVRWARISTSDVSEIVLAPTPGAVFVATNDGGSARVPLSAIAIEVRPERKVRLHDLGNLQRMYAGRGIWVSSEYRTASAFVSRRSAQVPYRWIPLIRREWLTFAGIIAYGVLCFLMPVPGL